MKERHAFLTPRLPRLEPNPLPQVKPEKEKPPYSEKEPAARSVQLKPLVWYSLHLLGDLPGVE